MVPTNYCYCVYMIILKMSVVNYVIIIYYHIVLIIRLFMNSTCSHNRISEWGMVQAIGLQYILYWFRDHRVNIGYNYSSTWEIYLFNH